MQINILQNDEDAFLKHHPEAIKKPGRPQPPAIQYTCKQKFVLKKF